MFRPCIVIPCYNHGATMPALLGTIADLGVPCLVVNDGSGEETTAALAALAETHEDMILLGHDTNRGKGAATVTGFREAHARGYTHALQIDADGQHDTGDIPAFLREAESAPGHVISGRPLFDETIPKSRYYGRYLTHALVWLETLSFDIADSMCGFRSYPLEATLRVIEREGYGTHMDFDTGIIVRLHRNGVPVKFIPTRVVYPPRGLSNFRLVGDNVKMTTLHLRLLLGMPALLFRRRNPAADRPGGHWASHVERGSLVGLFIALWIHRYLGRLIFPLVLYPVITYFWLTGTSARKASQQYLRQLKETALRKQHPLPPGLNSFRLFLRFAHAIFDKLTAWSGHGKGFEVIREPIELYEELLNRKEGLVFIGSHLGDLEYLRAVAGLNKRVKVNALMYTRGAQHFYRALNRVNPQSMVNLIQVEHLGPETLYDISKKIEAGEWVVIMGDRTPAGESERIVWVDFLGKSAPFPQGPLLLASLLGAPVYLMFALLEPRGRTFRIEHFADRIVLPRKTRNEALAVLVQRYAHRLEAHCLLAPLDWFNFFDFWPPRPEDPGDE